MPSFTAAIALGIFAYKAMAQTSTFDPPITFANVTAGQVQAIGWTLGDGTPVSLFLGNTTWNMGIFGMSDVCNLSRTVHRLTSDPREQGCH
jgi:hypothetical protein